MTTPRDYSSIVFSPEEIGILGSKYLEDRRANKGAGVPVGLASIDKILYPALPGELISLIARPGHGKTGFMVRWARSRAAWLRENKIENRVVVYITLEQSIEELNAFNVAADNRLLITSLAKGEITDDEWKACLKYAINRRFAPLWNIGYSSTTEKKQIRIDADAIENALRLITEHDKIDIVFIDYLQRIPYSGRAESKTVGISDNLDALKTIAQQVARAPVVVGVQARREVDECNPQIPQMDDGQWTSNIEQTSDRVLSIVRPINYKPEGEMFGKTLIEGRNQAIVSILKQRLGPANLAVWVYFQPEYNKLAELEANAQSFGGSK
jgi:replicative DNA helicase